jgi:hypothetical protein
MLRLALLGVTFTLVFPGCGGESQDTRCQQNPEQCSGTVTGFVTLDESNIPADDLVRAQKSSYTGQIRLVFYNRWPPWNIGGSADSLAENFKFINPIRLQTALPFNFVGLNPGRHWITAMWRPMCNATIAGSTDDGDFLASGPCTGTCDAYEEGKGVPTFEVSAAKQQWDGVVVRLNTVFHSSTKPVASRCD